MARKLYTTRELWDLDQKVNDEIDKLMDANIKRGLVGRLIDASAWLCMMQRCVKTDDAVIDLDTHVTVALWDAYLI